MTKNVFGDNRVESTLTAEKSSFKRNTVDVWQNWSFFNKQSCDFAMKKDKMPENTVLYINQGYQSYKDNKKVYYADYLIVGQINQCLNPPETIETYGFKDNKVKMYRPCYDTVTGQFQGLYETLVYLMVRSDSDKCFLDYGFSK